MATERVLHMKGGEGETSYIKNSLLQRKVGSIVKPILEDNVKLLMSNITSESCWKVADLGCSSGTNSLLFVSNMLSLMDSASLSLNQSTPPVLQIYMNDLFGNDFNIIFKLIPDFLEGIHEEKNENHGRCFIHATPGNFYGRLFPDDYIHFFHSSYSLHWLSQAPTSTNIVEPLNKGNVYITSDNPPSVYEAYLKQFEKDFKLFLKSRSEELRSGGIMLLTFIGREKSQDMTTPWGLIGTVLNDMVQEFRLLCLLSFMGLYMLWRKFKRWGLLMFGWNVILLWFVLRLLLGLMFLGCFVFDEILVLITVGKSGLGLLIENLFIGIIGYHLVCS
ncbi:probable caffeine synthase MTL2 isoform X2 [Phaseolus vulgaris]|uniref:probable caffeine synthase MTL2 isoform X2 n=1 Tax=Phaseolus vulgaris TaxID=3885 RepID=UPI0035CB02E4